MCLQSSLQLGATLTQIISLKLNQNLMKLQFFQEEKVLDTYLFILTNSNQQYRFQDNLSSIFILFIEFAPLTQQSPFIFSHPLILFNLLSVQHISDYHEIDNKQYKLNMSIEQWYQSAINCKPITQSSVRSLCNLVKGILAEESNIVSVDSPVNIAGDVHGQFFDVKNMLQKGGNLPDSKFILIGDFVDRGYNSVETITLLFCLKVKYPDRIYLLRGNHESRNITMMYGFLDEINKKYGNSNCWKYFYETFDFLPLGAIVNGNILCVHGGLSPDLPTIDQMRLLDRKQEIPNEGPLADLMWSDPQNIEAWRRNSRGAGWIFGHKVVDHFNLLNDLSLIVRAHQLVQEGYLYWFNEQLVTVWSAPNYCYRMNNKAALLHLDENSNRHFIIFETVPESAQSKNYRTLMPYFL